VVYNYYKEKFSHDYETLVRKPTKIDSAELSLDEGVHPENYPYVILSMTIQSHRQEDAPYWNLLGNLLQTDDAEKIVNILKSAGGAMRSLNRTAFMRAC
jgi:hypothetical protein